MWMISSKYPKLQQLFRSALLIEELWELAGRAYRLKLALQKLWRPHLLADVRTNGEFVGIVTQKT